MVEVGSKPGERVGLTQLRPPHHHPLVLRDRDPQQIRLSRGRRIQGGLKSHFVAVGTSNRIW